MSPQFDEAVAAFQRGDLDRARALGEQLLATGADSAGLDHLLGLIDCRIGHLESGIERLRRAHDKSPGDMAVRVMLARALIDAGRSAEGLEIAQPPSGSSPAELALWHARAEAATATAAWPQAAEAWEQVCVARARDAGAWSNYAHALASGARWAHASAAFRRALELDPAEASLRRALATALAHAGKYDEAADELSAWVEARPEDVRARIAFARLLADLGREQEALAQLDRAAGLATGAAVSISSVTLMRMAELKSEDGVDLGVLRDLAYLLERMSRLDLLSDLLAEAEANGIGRDQLGYPVAALSLRRGEALEAKRILLSVPPEDDPTRWHWLMSRIADALGDSAAFSEAEAMNRSVNDHDSWRERAAKYLQWTRGLRAVLTPEWAAQLRTLPSAERRSPAFLVGFPRSGTTLLDTFLMGHRDTAVLEERPMMAAVARTLGDICDLPKCSVRQLEQARRAYFRELDRHIEPGFDGLVIDKMPLNMLAMPYIRCIFPDARIVFAQRHPCDCVLSCFMQGFALSNAMACFLDIEDAAALYDAAMDAWTGSGLILPVQKRTIVYEQLVIEPEAALRPVIEFLGLKWDEDLLDHRTTAMVRGVIGTPSYDQVIQPLSAKAVGRWRRYEKQLEPVLPVLLPWAKRLGYDD